MYENQFTNPPENPPAQNNTFTPSEMQNTVPVPNVTGTQKKDDKKQKLILLALIACLVCAVIGGIIGGAVSGSIVKKNTEKNETTPSYNQQSNEDNVTTTENRTEKQDTTEKQTEKGEENTIQSGTYTSSDEKPSLSMTFSASEIYKYCVDSVVSIEVGTRYGKGFGTGFIISEEGYIVTNYHVVENTTYVKVTLHNESVYDAEIVGHEESNDLAIIKIKPQEKIESLVYGKSNDLMVGDEVFVIGNPLGDLTFTLTTGVVSALNRLIDTGAGYTINMFQTDAAINSGNSGGPVFDEHGYVVGIASAKYASSSIEGLGFCVPIDDVRSMIDEIINKGYVSGKPLMGVSVYDKEITNFGFLQSQRSINGAKIAAIGENSAAAEAGLQVGDIIIAAGGETVRSVSELRTVLSDYRSGNALVVTISRNGVTSDVTLILDEYAPSSPRTQYSNVYDL